MKTAMAMIDGATSATAIIWSDVINRREVRGRGAATGRAAVSSSWRMKLLAQR
jgi:hypothetical protein